MRLKSFLFASADMSGKMSTTPKQSIDENPRWRSKFLASAGLATLLGSCGGKTIENHYHYNFYEQPKQAQPKQEEPKQEPATAQPIPVTPVTAQPTICYPKNIVCEDKAPDALKSFIVRDSDAGIDYLANVTKQTQAGRTILTITFNPPLRQCTTSLNGKWNWCGIERLYDRHLQSHNAKLNFFGEDMVITGIDLDLDERFNYLNLGKKIGGGILNIGEYIYVGNYKIRLDGIGRGATTEEQPAKLSFFDCNGNLITPNTVDIPSGKIRYITLPDGTKFIIQVPKLASGYTFGGQWAYVNVFASEIMLYSIRNDTGSVNLISPALDNSTASVQLRNWHVKINTDGNGRMLSLELSAPSDAMFKICK